MSVEGWLQKKVSDLCDLGRGRVISAQEIELKPGIYPVFSSQSQKRGEMGRIDTYDFDGEYITWTTDGAYAGTVFYRTGRFNCTNVCGTLHAKSSQLSMEFLAYKISTVAKKHVSYVGNPKLMNNVMSNIGLSLPEDPAEQTQIAAILSTIDRAIEQTEAIIAKQQRIKTGLMQDLLTKGIDEDGNVRSEETHEFKDSAIGRIPVEWEIRTLESIVDEPITYGIVQAGSHVDGGIPYIRTGDMAGDFLELERLLRTSKKIATSYKRSEVSAGDIVFALRATVGKVLPVSQELSGSNLTQGTAKISAAYDINQTFLLWALRSSIIARQIQLVQKGTTFSEITLGDLRKLRLIIPRR